LRFVAAGTKLNARRQLRTDVAVGETAQAVLAGHEALEQLRVRASQQLKLAQRRPAASFCGVVNRDAAGRAHSNDGTLSGLLTPLLAVLSTGRFWPEAPDRSPHPNPPQPR